MNKKTLVKLFERLGIKEKHYSLDGEMCEFRHEITKVGFKNWTVYYCERGQRESQMFFDNESDACVELAARVIDVVLLDPE